jgi:hypothetical protein
LVFMRHGVGPIVESGKNGSWKMKGWVSRHEKDMAEERANQEKVSGRTEGMEESTEVTEKSEEGTETITHIMNGNAIP